MGNCDDSYQHSTDAKKRPGKQIKKSGMGEAYEKASGAGPLFMKMCHYEGLTPFSRCHSQQDP
jgi:hypothetical protein